MLKSSEKTRLQNLELKAVVGGRMIPLLEEICGCFCAGNTCADGYTDGKHDALNPPDVPDEE